MAPKFLTVYSESPVQIEMDMESFPLAVGVTSICDSNVHRHTAQDSASISHLINTKPFSDQNAQVLGLALYMDEIPIEAGDIQPYFRPQRGLPCLFSMNGEVPGIEDNERYPIGDQWPLSCMPQERAFCLLQERIRKLWSEGWPDPEMRLALVSDYAGRLNRLSSHSFIHWDGEMLFAYSATETKHEPNAFIEYEERVTELKGEVCLKIGADESCRRLVIGSQSLLPAEAQVIGPGSTLCFRQGELVERCDPVDFWTGLEE